MHLNSYTKDWKYATYSDLLVLFCIILCYDYFSETVFIFYLYNLWTRGKLANKYIRLKSSKNKF